MKNADFYLTENFSVVDALSFQRGKEVEIKFEKLNKKDTVPTG